MSLIKYAPFAEFDSFPAGLRVFQDTVNRLFAEPGSRPWVPPVDIQETDQALVVKADLPDMEMKTIDVRLENGTLTLRGDRKFERKRPRAAGIAWSAAMGRLSGPSRCRRRWIPRV